MADTGGTTGTPDEPLEQTPPLGIAVLALVLGVVLVGGLTFGGILSVRSEKDTSEPRSPSAVPSSSSPDPPTAPVPTVPAPASDWQATLRSTTCPSPCAAGAACKAKATSCVSGLTCIPGANSTPLDLSGSWSLHLSAVQEKSEYGNLLDPCVTKRDLWLCRTGTPECVSQREACTQEGIMSLTGLRVGRIQPGDASSLEVREGGPTGPRLALTTAFPQYARVALCRGFGVGTDNPNIKKVTFFLLPGE